MQTERLCELSAELEAIRDAEQLAAGGLLEALNNEQSEAQLLGAEAA
jgi:hypothetical protein